MIKKQHSLEEFEAVHGQSKIKRLQHDVEVEKRKVEALAGKKEQVHFVEPSKTNVIKFGLIGDTHIGSLYCRMDLIKAFYESCAAQGITTVIHVGDMLDGWKVYRGQEFELRDVGFDAQMARLISEYPDVGITTRFITGNHDASLT
jgi:DNA polymerase II small subunit/DNA polymerase delta subunit B